MGPIQRIVFIFRAIGALWTELKPFFEALNFILASILNFPYGTLFFGQINILLSNDFLETLGLRVFEDALSNGHIGLAGKIQFRAFSGSPSNFQNILIYYTGNSFSNMQFFASKNTCWWMGECPLSNDISCVSVR